MASSVTTNLSAISASVTSTTNNNNNSTSSSSSFDNNNDNIKVDIIKSSPIIDEEIADEVKVFRSNTNDDDPNDGSSAELHADKQELALEADLESQTDFTQQHVNPIVNPFAPLHWPSPGSNFMFNSLLALSSPVYAAAQQKLAAAAIAQVYSAAATAAFVARHSPNYFNFGAQFGAPHAYEQPPSFSMGQPQCTTPSNNNNNNTSRNNNTNNCFNFQQQQHQLGSPMTSLGGVFGNICLGNDRGENSSAFKHQNNFDNQKQQQHLLSSTDKCYIDSRGQLKTPKLENNDHGRIKEKRHLHSNGKNNNNLNNESKREHIKKPMNAFMLFMKENRHKYMDETNDRKKQSAELNKELGQIWQKMSKDEQQPYYEMAQQKREEHQQLYPNWTARENYAIHKKAKRRRTRERSFENNDQKKCRARFGVDNQAKWCKHCRRKKRCLNVCDSSSPLHQN